MEIYGYSERGAMNALFYGMALDKEKGDASMRTFLKLAGIEEIYSDFELYMEFSLSEFGAPDLIIVANKPNNDKVVFFVEAKTSCGKSFSWIKEKEKYTNTIDCETFFRGEASNLFFQLRLKYYFFNKVIKGRNVDCPHKIKMNRKGERNIGKNIIAQKIATKIKECVEAKYIAVIPDEVIPEKKDIHVVSWLKLYNNEELRPYLISTIVYNQGIDPKSKKEKNQILNNL